MIYYLTVDFIWDIYLCGKILVNYNFQTKHNWMLLVAEIGRVEVISAYVAVNGGCRAEFHIHAQVVPPPPA